MTKEDSPNGRHIQNKPGLLGSQDSSGEQGVSYEKERLLVVENDKEITIFEWRDESQMYDMTVKPKTNGNAHLLPHWKLSPKLQDHLKKEGIISE